MLILDRRLDRGPGVYAFARDGVVHYVGVASRCIASRLNFCRRPAESQRTNVRLKALLLDGLETSEAIDVLIARPETGSWNGLPVHTSAGLELGLIHAYRLPWNRRILKISTRPPRCEAGLCGAALPVGLGWPRDRRITPGMLAAPITLPRSVEVDRF